MITYIATNTKTGQFYIGSARDYCRYMSRIGYHHTLRNPYPFQKDLQADPHAFRWEWFEDDLDTNDWEKSLIELYFNSKYCYNIGSRYERTDKHRGWNHSEATRKRMSESAKTTSIQRSKVLSTVVNSKEPCPHCGKLMNPGNLKQHLRAMTCQKQG